MVVSFNLKSIEVLKYITKPGMIVPGGRYAG
jgi:hypothetical protein